MPFFCFNENKISALMASGTAQLLGQNNPAKKSNPDFSADSYLSVGA
jgi:hypothetical protein